MTVLDIGCGVGDVSLQAAGLVGPSGAVLGVDRSRDALATASRRATQADLHWARFAASEIDEFVSQDRFDALIGRLVLMYLPDPATTVRRLSTLLKPGAVVVFQELVMPLARGVPDEPLYRQCRFWITEAFARLGLEVDMGSRLFATFCAAGLPPPRMIVAGRAEGGPDSPIYDYLAQTLRSLMPVIERTGAACAADIEVDTLAERLRAEAIRSNACMMTPPLIGAWTRLPT